MRMKILQNINGIIEKLKSYDWKELENERLGFDYHKEIIEEKTKPNKTKKKKRLGLFVNDEYYETIEAASKALNVNRYTLSDWLKGRQRSDMKEKLKLKREVNEEND
jgi:hypothetical protein